MGTCEVSPSSLGPPAVIVENEEFGSFGCRVSEYTDPAERL